MKSTACSLILCALLAAFALALPDCRDSDLAIQTCGEIPDDGCPIGGGGTCDDVTCPALYDCEGGAWVLVQTCPNNLLGGGGAGGNGAGGSGGLGAGGCEMVDIDIGEQAMGCMPDLETPDCPIEAAETCVNSACLTGCCGFDACKATPGGPEWTEVAFCNDQGQLIIETPDGGVPATRRPPRRH
jgi:hypothetical protein